MNMPALARYRNLNSLTHQEWVTLDIHLFIAANFNRYCSGLLKKIGYQHLPSDANESLLGLFCITAYKPLCSVHEKHRDAIGEQRNQIMLGTLKMISMTRMVDALINEFPAYVPLESLPTSHSDDKHGTPQLADDSADLFVDEPTDEQDEVITPEEHDRLQTLEEQRLSDQVELVRHHLTVSQYQTFRHLLCDRMDIQQIADITNTSPTNIRIMLQNIRRRLFGMLPADFASKFEDCLHRK